MPAWTTKDYFDPFPGIAAGMAGARLAEDVAARRDSAKERALDRAVGDQRYAQEQQRYAQEQQMRQAEMLSRMGVDPVVGANGGIDWTATSKAARAKMELMREAESLGATHGWNGGPSSLTQQEYALTQTPEYQRSYRSAALLRQQEEFKRLAQMEQIAARGQAQLAVAKQRGDNATQPSATVTEKSPDGLTTIRRPATAEELAGRRPGDGSTVDPWDQAAATLDTFKDNEEVNLVGGGEGEPPKIQKDDIWRWGYSKEEAARILERKRIAAGKGKSPAVSNVNTNDPRRITFKHDAAK